MRLALEELGRLQEEGPDAADVAAALEVDGRAHELARQENSFWLERLVQGYRSQRFGGDVDRCHAALDAARARVLPGVTPEELRGALRRIFPYPCQGRYTAAALVPHEPIWCAARRPPRAHRARPSPGLSLGSPARYGEEVTERQRRIDYAQDFAEDEPAP